jgi:hypothetical protein
MKLCYSIYEFKLKTPNEKFLWNAYEIGQTRTEYFNKTRTTLMECEIDKDTPEDVSDYENNTQSGIIILKIQTNIHDKAA